MFVNVLQAEYDMGPLADEAFVAAHAASELTLAWPPRSLRDSDPTQRAYAQP